ncbi:MAG: hypothetical protein IIC69_03405 [Nanoarchaeota archaeon]|nr:hypothetical protein [Nanoarchaeota archaeon]
MCDYKEIDQVLFKDSQGNRIDLTVEKRLLITVQGVSIYTDLKYIHELLQKETRKNDCDKIMENIENKTTDELALDFKKQKDRAQRDGWNDALKHVGMLVKTGIIHD